MITEADAANLEIIYGCEGLGRTLLANRRLIGDGWTFYNIIPGNPDEDATIPEDDAYWEYIAVPVAGNPSGDVAVYSRANLAEPASP